MKIANDKLASDRKQLQEIIKPGGGVWEMHRRGCLQHVHWTFQHLTSYLYFIPYVTLCMDSCFYGVCSIVFVLT